MNRRLCELEDYRLLFNGKELLVEQAQGRDCSYEKRWLPAPEPIDPETMNRLLKGGLFDHYNRAEIGLGVVLCVHLHDDEYVRIVHNCEGVQRYFEHVEKSTTCDGLGKKLWYEVEDIAAQNALLAPVAISLCPKH